MLILILIHVQYSQKAAFSFEKGSNHQNHSSSGSLHPVKTFPPPPTYHLTLTTIWKTLGEWERGDGAEKTIHGATNKAKMKRVLIISTNYATVF